ncbi:MAG: glycosyltransferase family 9 protein [Planctomycetes bacterium]|nr:glycosyltransferase family 9 protein [Planctomycetota bacterium]
MDYEELPKIDRLGGSLARDGLKKIRRITTKITGRLKIGRGENDPFSQKKLNFSEHPDNILLVKLWGIGNMVLAGRAFASIRKAYFRSRITMLTTPECQEVYEQGRFWDDPLVFAPQDAKTLPQAMNSICKEISKGKFSLAVNFEGLSELAEFLACRNNIKTTVGFSPVDKPSNYTLAVPWDAEASIEELFYKCARATGGEAMPPGLIAPRVNSKEKDYCERLLSEFEIDPHALLIGINVNAGSFFPQRCWPPEKFALLAQMLEAEREFRTVFIGAPGEERYVAKSLRLMEHSAIDLSGRLTLPQLKALLQRLHLLIGNDSGPAHLAAALGVPTVTLFGPESPTRVGRQGEEKHANIQIAADCSPCISLLGMERNICEEGAACIRDIPVETVHRVVMDMLDHLSDPEDPPWLASVEGDSG